jgi:epoxyqueuosine reductase
LPLRTSIAEFVQSAAREEAFDLAGIAPARAFPELQAFPEWIASGNAGEMRYLAARDEFGRLKRAALENAAPWAKSVIVVARNYNAAGPRTNDPHNTGAGWVSRYAWAQQDYHDHMLASLRALETQLHATVADPALRTWCYVDTGPVIERVFAKYAGVGWIGKNTCVINQQIGSWIFLGVMLTSLELTPSLPAADRCGTCTRCIEVCPTDALTPYAMDASRCIAYLTIEKRGEVPDELREGIGRHVFGCDLCQDVCPWNRKAAVSSSPEFQPREALVNPSLEWLATISEEEFRRAFKGSPLKRTKRSGIRRNAVIALGNSGDTRFVPLLERLAQDQDAVVAEHSKWAAEKLRSLELSQ